jgi:hypothetical protein
MERPIGQRFRRSSADDLYRPPQPILNFALTPEKEAALVTLPALGRRLRKLAMPLGNLRVTRRAYSWIPSQMGRPIIGQRRIFYAMALATPEERHFWNPRIVIDGLSVGQYCGRN